MRKGKISDLIGDNIFFRELNPQNPDLVPIDVVLFRLNLDRVPRKKDPEYPQVISYYLNLLGDFDRILFIGDTMISDRFLVLGLLSLNKYEVFAIITRESGEKFELKQEGDIIYSNRWSFMRELPDFLAKRDFYIDEKTAVIIDIDKTLIGARGRNDHAIDLARAEAVYKLLKKAGISMDFNEFFNLYKHVNSPDFFNITQDNQDIVAFVTIALSSGIVKNITSLEETAQKLMTGKHPFLAFLGKEIITNLKKKSPTLFPTFREMEYFTTIEFMDRFDDSTPIEKLLKEEIFITGEIYDLFENSLSTIIALTDKPELSSLPPEGTDLPPIHKKLAKIYP